MAGGVLYVVATPIGNLEDLSPRAVRILREVDLVAAEDTRRTRILLQQHGIAKRMTAYHDVVERERAPALVEKLQEGKRVALVSDAGTPGIADPGYHLVRGAVAAGIPVVPIPGASAVAALLSVAGLPVERFVFEGFLPSRPGPRRLRLRALADETRSVVFLEAPTRLLASLTDMHDLLGDREAVLGRELTKLHEELLRGRLSVLQATLAARPRVRGECVLLVTGAAEQGAAAEPVDVEARIEALRAQGLGTREIAAQLARETGASRRTMYQRVLAAHPLR